MSQSKPDLESRASESHDLEVMDVEEVITLSENRFSNESLTPDGWTQTDGMLERRLEQTPVASERRQSRVID